MLNYLEEGNKKIKSKDYKGALSDYDKVIELDENDVVAYNNRGQARYYLGDKEGAISDYDKAIEIDKNEATIYYNRGVIRSELGYKEEAMLDYDKAIELDKNEATAYSNRGSLRSELGYKEEAMLDYDKAIELDKNNAKAYSNRGALRAELGYKEEAMSDYDKAIELDKNNAVAYYNRASLRSELGYKEEAMLDYDKAIELDENNAGAYYNRGNHRLELGYKEEAMSDYNKAIELDENNARAYNNRGIVKRDIIDCENFLNNLESLPNKKKSEILYLEEIMNAVINDLETAVKLDGKNKLYSNNLKKTKEIFDDFKFEIGLNPQTQTGFLVFADIMGWKGIWQKKDFDENTTLKTMLRIKQRILKVETEYELNVNLISDTFVIFSDQLKVISNACKILIESCLDSNLVIRGAMAYGTYYNLDTVYVGPTVDEAASWHEKAEEVAIMCTTSARMAVKNSIENSNSESNYGMIKHDVCTKQGKIETYVIDWYTKENEEKFINIMKGTQVYPELYNKYNNTEKSLKKILEEKAKSEVREI